MCEEMIKKIEKIILKNYNKYDGTMFEYDAALDIMSIFSGQIEQLKGYEDFFNRPAVQSLINERKCQDEKWGEQNHDPYTFLTILMEEIGEYAQACLQTQFGGSKGGVERMRQEAVQVAAVALAIVECLDREKWTWKGENKEIHKEVKNG